MQIGEETEITISDFFKLTAKEGGKYKVSTPDGWCDLGELVKKKNKKCYSIRLDNGMAMAGSEDHLVETKEGWKKLKDLEVENDMILTSDGFCELVTIESIGVHDTYDFEVLSEKHRYFANGIVSHNSGKSLIAKACSSEYGIPLLRLDFGALFRSHVGESEATTRDAIKLAEACAPSALWCDEVEKGLSGTKSSGSTDGGTTDRVVSTFLTWMQEKTSEVFVVATANDIEKIPVPFYRRFDEIFFVDFPNKEERVEIAQVLLRRYKRDYKKFDCERIAELSNLYTGSEIEKAITIGLFEAFEHKRKLTTDDIVNAFNTFTPQYKMREEYFDNMRDHAQSCGFVFANEEVKESAEGAGGDSIGIDLSE